CARGEIKPNALISSGMVLQRDKTITLWGSATAGDTLTITLNAKSPVESTYKVETSGKWKALIPAQKEGGPYTLTIEGKVDDPKITINDVYIGEVWVCSGQSNMEMGLAGADPEEAQKRSRNEKIHLFTVHRARSANPETTVVGNWVECNPKSA